MTPPGVGDAERTLDRGARPGFLIAIFSLVGVLFALVGCGPTGASLTSSGDSSQLELAERLESEGQLEEAAKAYDAHMLYRLSLDRRPEWENPYFYLLKIGDLRLRQDRVREALASYRKAASKGVEKELISDRFRAAVEHLEEKGRFGEAETLALEHRTLDPLLFDSLLDRIAKTSVALEENGQLEDQSERRD
jgi:tetratricopeptide (TPR) repeat protein